MESPAPHSSLIPNFLLKSFYKLLYHQLYWTYDSVAAMVSFGRWNEWVRSTLTDLKGPRILEIGHGPGHLLVAMSQAGFRPIGLDASRWMSHLAQRRLRKAGFQPALINGYTQYTCFQSGAFDQVVATFPAEYIFDPLTTKEIYRILAPAGYWVILCAARTIGKSILQRTFARILNSSSKMEMIQNLLVLPFEQVGFRVEVDERFSSTSKLLIIKAFK